MENLMIPKKEQIFGECRLKPIEKRGTAAFITDYAILNGGSYSIDDNSLKNNGSYFLNYYEKIKNNGILNYVLLLKKEYLDLYKLLYLSR